jgi:flavorubredoxin
MNIKNIGVNDHQIDLFEGQYFVPNGMRYNSYILFDEKIVLFDTVDKHFTNEWLDNIEKELNGKKPDYIVVHHMEPDHSGSLFEFLKKYPSTKIIASKKAFEMMANFSEEEFNNEKVVVDDTSIINIGKNNLSFVSAPLVHWPEVIMTYADNEKALFTADAFGKFGATDINEDWLDEARRYYFGIVGKYGPQVNSLLTKIINKNIEINTIYSLHGPILDSNISYYLDLYKKWASYEGEDEGVLVTYCSIYGNTKNAIDYLEHKLREKNINCEVIDLSRCDITKALALAFKYKRIVLASVTYNMDVFPFMKEFINHLTERNYQNRKIGLIENGSWALNANNTIKKMLSNSKNLEFCQNEVHIKSAFKENNKVEIDNLVAELIK